jgi:hypothetical protein
VETTTPLGVVMIALVTSTPLDKTGHATLNRILDRTIDPSTNQRIPDLPLLFPSQVGEGDVLVSLDEESCVRLTGWSGHESLRGYVFEGIKPTGTHVVPTYSPERIRKGGWHLATVVQRDILRAFDVARNGPPRFQSEYVTYPSPEELAAFMGGWDPLTQPLAFDIETPYSEKKDENMSFEEDPSYTILMVSLAYEPFRAVSIPWSPPFDAMAGNYLAEAKRSLVWNAPFDVPRLQANGVNFQGEVVDAMLAWHWLEPALPMGLKFVAPFYCPEMPAWKLEAEKNLAWYNAADSDTLLRCFLGIREELEEQQRWGVFERHFLEFGKVLREMGNRGVLVNKESRREDALAFGKELGEIESKIQPFVPAEVKPVHPRRGYKGTEEELRKKGKWVEDGMRSITVELTEHDLEIAERKKARERKKRINDAHMEAKRMNREWERALKRVLKDASEERKKEAKRAKGK